MEKRTTDIITVLKWNTDLKNGAPSEKELEKEYSLPDDYSGESFYLLALYLQDDCDCPIWTYYKHPGIVFSELKKAAEDYISTCDHPGSFLRDYFKYRASGKSEFNSLCLALFVTQVRSNNTFVNGFTKDDVGFYYRQREFYKE